MIEDQESGLRIFFVFLFCVFFLLFFCFVFAFFSFFSLAAFLGVNFFVVLSLLFPELCLD